MGCFTTWRTAVKARWGWVVVFAASILCAVTYGIMYSFGLLMVALIDEFNSGVTKTGYVGTTSYGISMVACLLTSPMTTKIGYRCAVFLGVTLCVVALITTSFAPSISLMFLSYSSLYGVGCSAILCCVINCPMSYFPNKHRSMAIGLVSAGVNIGALVFNPVVYALINRFGWRVMIRIMSGILAMAGCFCVATFTPAPSEPCQLSSPVSYGPKDSSVPEDIEFERDKPKDRGCNTVFQQKTEPSARLLSGSDYNASSNRNGSCKSRTILENDTATEISVQRKSSKDSHKPELQGNGSVLAAVDEPRHFDRTAGLHKAVGSSPSGSSKGCSDEKTVIPCTWLHGLGILRMPEMWLIQLGYVTVAVALSFAYFSTVNMTISSGFSKKTAALVMHCKN
ncbi:monocarboxylate transporter 9-like [Diadema antillarum]|uniref:monocarboxylate transporter 9-like n=1 Tax=Diadema antillarum TaxID=105358 RepID=UPI003A891259